MALVSDDATAELALRLAPWMEFGYGDNRGFDSADEFEGMLVIFFRLGKEGEEADRIALAEVLG